MPSICSHSQHANWWPSSTHFPGHDLAERLSLAHFETIAALLSSSGDKSEIYIICVPSGLHVRVATDVLNAAAPKAILVEKPFSTDSQSGAQLIALADRKGSEVAVGHHRRFHPAVSTARQVIESGKLGKLTAISGV